MSPLLGGGLPPMVLTFIACDIARSRSFWERYAAGQAVRHVS
jgi:hypothetical protein